MAWLALLAGGLLILVMIGIAGYGWVTLPPDARVPIHHGIRSYDNYVSKRVGLVTWPMAGLLVYAILIAVAGHAIAPDHASRPVALIILLVALAAISAAQAGAIRAARGSTPGSSS